MRKYKIILWILALIPYFLLSTAIACNAGTLTVYLSYIAHAMEFAYAVFLALYLTISAKIRIWKAVLLATASIILYAAILVLAWIIWSKFFTTGEFRPVRTNKQIPISKPTVGHLHAARIRDGFHYFQLQHTENSNDNQFLLLQKHHPNNLKLHGHLYIPQEMEEYVSAELFLKVTDTNKLQIFLRKGCVEAGWKFSRALLQGCTGIKYSEKNVQQGKFFLKTTTASDGKFKSKWDELSEGETGFFIYPLRSCAKLPPNKLEQIRLMLQY